MYAAKTSVPVDRSQAEIRKLLEKYGAESFGFGQEATRASVMFDMSGRRINFLLPLPTKPTTTQVAMKIYDQTCRSRWRSLALVIKAKLECVEAGISTLEDEFLANVMLPNGKTVGQEIKEPIRLAYENKKMPPLLGYESRR